MSEKVLIQGTEHSFHDQAAGRLGVPRETRQSVKTHDLLYAQLRTDPHGRAVVAVANTTKGRIGGSYERVLAGAGTIIGRTDLDIVLPLYGIPGATPDDIAFIHTQSHAMEQCMSRLAERYARAFWVSETDTAMSALSVRALNDRAHAAITPHPAGQAAGLECLVPNMRDNEDLNVTTFYMLGKGNYAVVPVDSTVTVAALDRIDHKEGSQLLQAVGVVSLINQADIDAESLIVEINSGGAHAEAIDRVQADILGAYDVCFLGGYAPQAVTPATTSLVAVPGNW